MGAGIGIEDNLGTGGGRTYLAGQSTDPERAFTAAGLALITLTDAPAGLTVGSGKVLAPRSDMPGFNSHRSAEITLSYSGAAITTDQTVTVTVRGHSSGNSGLLRNSARRGSIGNISAAFTIKVPPVVSIAADSGAVTEGGNAVFTLTASPAPAADIRVNVRVRQTGSFVLRREIGLHTLIIGTSGMATMTFATNDDNTEEAGGAIMATVQTGSGYSPHDTQASASVAVNDNDGDNAATPVASFAAASSSAAEDAGTRNVTVNLLPAPQSAITLVYTVGGTATPGSGNDFTIANSGSVAVSSGQASVTIPVAIIDDSADEPAETVVLTLTGGSGYTVGSPNVHRLTINDGGGTTTTTPPVTTTTPSPTTDGTDDDDQDESPDRNALELVYVAAVVPGWNRNEPVEDWPGVEVDGNDRVTEILLGDSGLSGTIHPRVGDLDELRRLYLNDNGLRGEIPEEIGELDELEELALWGNPELTGSVPPGFENRVDRAVLRTLKNVNGDSALSSWFRQDDDEMPFAYSGWEGVEADDERVIGLDLSNTNLSKEITGVISEISALETLDLSGNPALCGELPLELNRDIRELDIDGTRICVPDDHQFRVWLAGIDFMDSEDCAASCPAGVEEPAAGSSGGGGCSVASGKPGEGAYQFVLFALALAAAVWGIRKN